MEDTLKFLIENMRKIVKYMYIYFGRSGGTEVDNREG